MSENPITFLNLEDFPFVEYNEAYTRVTVKTNEIPKDERSGYIVIKIKLENKDGLSAEYNLGVLMIDTDKLPDASENQSDESGTGANSDG